MSFWKASCDRKTEDGNELRQLEGVYWFWSNGDVIEKIQCMDKTAPIVELESCYRLTPIHLQGEIKWVRPTDRLLVNQATPTECNSHFGLKLHMLEVEPERY